MPDPHPGPSGRLLLRRIRVWGFRALVFASVVWGMLSAVVVFAVRYDLLPETDPGGAVAARGLSWDEARDWPKLPVSDWRQVLSPDSVLAIVRTDTSFATLFNAGKEAGPSPVTVLQLLWDPETNGSLWLAQLAVPACNCPFDRADRWNYGRLVLDPQTGNTIGRVMRTAVDTDELRRSMIPPAPGG
jgi:hypothetical protein